jgi:rhodanese-related sulfurtransferase
VEPAFFFKFVENNLLMFAVAVTSGVMLLLPLVRRVGGGASVSTTEATQLMNREDALVLDVRDPGEYGAGHILGAKSVPLARAEAGDIPGEVAKKKDRPLIVYCERGDSAPKAAAALRKQGFDKVSTLSGGLAAWRQAGLPVQKK